MSSLGSVARHPTCHAQDGWSWGLRQLSWSQPMGQTQTQLPPLGSHSVLAPDHRASGCHMHPMRIRDAFGCLSWHPSFSLLGSHSLCPLAGPTVCRHSVSSVFLLCALLTPSAHASMCTQLHARGLRTFRDSQPTVPLLCAAVGAPGHCPCHILDQSGDLAKSVLIHKTIMRVTRSPNFFFLVVCVLL